MKPEALEGLMHRFPKVNNNPHSEKTARNQKCPLVPGYVLCSDFLAGGRPGDNGF